MASNKSLMESIEANVSSIRKSKFGTKLPSNANEEKKNTEQELAYEQMIMGTLASLTWGIKKLSKSTDIRSYFNRANIFETIKDINKNINANKQIFAGLVKNNKTQLNKVIDLLQNINIPIPDNFSGINISEVNLREDNINKLTDSIYDKFKNESNISSSSIDINITNLDSLNKLVETLSSNQSRINVYRGITSIIELLTFLDSNDLKNLDKSTTENLGKLSGLLQSYQTQLKIVFDNIKNIAGEGNVDADLRSLSLIIDNIIKIISIDPKTINLKGLRYLVRTTNPERGLIAELFNNINNIAKGVKLEQNNFIVLGRFFESLAMLADIGFIRRRRIRDNISFIKKYVIGMIPDIIKELQKVVDDNQKDAYTAIGNLSAIFSALSELSELDIKKRFKLMINLEFIKDIYISQIVSILKEIENVSKESASASMALNSINEVIKTILTLGDISLLKIMLISEKSDILMSIVSDKISSVLESIININNINEALISLNDLNELFEFLDNIYNVTPGLKQSLHESLKLSYISHIIDSIGILITNINNVPKFTRQDTLSKTWPQLFTSIYTLLDNKELSKFKEINDSVIYVNDTLLPNIFSIILSVNNMPKLTSSRSWKSVLKSILKEFDDAEDDSLANILVYKLNRGILEDISCLSDILIYLSNVVNNINSIKEFDEDKINALLDVTKTIVEQFNEDNKDSIASNFANINNDDLEKVDNIVKLLEKLSKISKINLFISEKTIKSISIIGKPVKTFVETLGSIKEEDLKRANDAINAFYKITIGGALILVSIGLLVKYIKLDALLSFTLILGGFLFGLTGILWLLSKSLKDSMKYAKDAMIFVGACAAILLFGSLVNNHIKWEELFGFLFKIGIFITGVATILWVLSALYKGKLMNDGFAALAKMSLLMALSSAVMVLATMAYEYIKWDALFGFLGMFALYIVVVGGICALLGLLKKYLVIGALILAGIMVLTVLAMGVMQLMYNLSKQEDFYDTILEGLESMGWVFGSFIAVIAGLGASCFIGGGLGAVALGAGMAALYAIEELIGEAAKVMNMIYVALSNFKNLDLDGSDFDRIAEMIKGFAMISVLLIDKMPTKQLLKLQLGGASAINKTALAVGSIAKALKEFSTLKIPTEIGPDGKPSKYVTVGDADFATAQENIGKVITCVVDGVLSVAQTHPELFDVHLIKDSKAMNAAKVVNKMGQAIGSIAKGIAQFASQKMPIEFDDNGRPTKYIRMTAPLMRTAGATIKSVMICIGSALTSTVKDNPELFEEGTIADSPAMNAAKTLKVMGDVIANTASAIGALASGKVPTYDKDGKLTDPSKWLTFNLSDLAANGPVYNAVNSILTCLGNALNAVVNNEDNKWMFDDGMVTKSPAMEAAIAMKNMGDALNSTIDAITKISELKTEDLTSKIDTMKTNIQSAIGSILEVFKIFTNTKDTGIQKEAVKSGLRGFVNDLSTFVGGSGKVFETNGSIAQYINDNIDEITDAGDAIEKITSIISSIISSLSKVGAANDNLKKYKDLFDSSPTSSTSLSNIFKSIMIQLTGIHGSITAQFGEVDLDDRIKKTKQLNELIGLYVDNLNSIVKLSKYAEENGDEGYNVLRDGILKIYEATSQITSVNLFGQHSKKLQQYVQSINSVKLNNLAKLKGFVDSINELSQRLGNLDKLTDAIGNKLSQVLYELVLQLRKAEATIHNAHELQEKRKKLMDESMKKIENIMNQHMIVEISQKKEGDTSTTSSGLINDTIIDSSTPQGTDTTPSTTNSSTPKLDNPESSTAANGTTTHVDKSKLSKDILTDSEFKRWMTNDFITLFRSQG